MGLSKTREMARKTVLVLVVWLGLLTLLALNLTLRRTTTRSLELSRENNPARVFPDPPPEGTNLGRLERSEYVASVVESLLNSTEETDPRAAFEQVVALSSLLPRLTNVSRLKTPSPEAFRNYIARVGLPVVFTDMLEGSRLREWTWDYVRARWGRHVFHNTRQGNYTGKKSTSGKYSVNRVSVTLADFIDVVTGRRAPREAEVGLYITKQRIIPPEDLEAEFVYPPFYPGPHKSCFLEPTAWYDTYYFIIPTRSANTPDIELYSYSFSVYCKGVLKVSKFTCIFRIGAPGTFTQGHIDSKDNFAYQILGKKQWTIFPPTDYKYLYYVQRTGSLEWSTALNSLTSPNLNKYPLYAKATPITFTMSPGEVLYLPRGWTHTVTNLTPALMINTWRYGPAAITEAWSEKNRDEIKRKCLLSH